LRLTLFGEAEKYGTEPRENAEFLHFGVSSWWHKLRVENGCLDRSSAEEDWRPFMVCEPSTK